MQKMNNIPQIVFENLTCNLIGGDLAYDLRIRCFPDMQLSLNDIANYGAHLKH